MTDSPHEISPLNAVLYKRAFYLSVAHFNGIDPYMFFWDMNDNPSEKCPFFNEEMIRICREIHGHNFKIEVEIRGSMGADDSWLVDDQQVEAVVMQWNNINVSLHQDFLSKRMRATTENMARVLRGKIGIQLAEMQLILPRCSVRVYETHDISATAY